jgi:hypothetical protein
VYGARFPRDACRYAVCDALRAMHRCGSIVGVSAFVAIVLAAMTSACTGPAAYPRSGEVAEVGALHAEASTQVASNEPQRATYAEGSARSDVAFLPSPLAALRVGVVPRCEIGGSIPMPIYWGRYIVEVRCAVVKPSEARIAIAASGAGGVATGLGHSTAAWGRTGIDASLRLGPITAMLGAYVSRGPEWHYMQLSDAFGQKVGKFVPPDGPIPVNENVTRDETRFTFPFGLGIFLDRDPKNVRADLIFGVVPWIARSHDGTVCDAPCLSYEAERGIAFTIGMEML